jgi:hypothetical protein
MDRHSGSRHDGPVTDDHAIELAEEEADEYAALLEAGVEYLGLAQSYRLADEPGHGAEVFSILREFAAVRLIAANPVLLVCLAWLALAKDWFPPDKGTFGPTGISFRRTMIRYALQRRSPNGHAGVVPELLPGVPRHLGVQATPGRRRLSPIRSDRG